MPLTTIVSVTLIGGSTVCDEVYGYIEVPENTPVGTILKEITCSSNSGEDLIYDIKTGNIHGKFGINTSHGVGQVFVNQPISYESRTVKFQVNFWGHHDLSQVYISLLHLMGPETTRPSFGI